MKKFKAFLFDCDGTVVDSDKLIIDSWANVVKILAPDIVFKAEDIIKHFGVPFAETVDLLAEQYNIPSSEYNIDVLYKAYWGYHASHRKDIAGTFPEEKETLIALKEAGAKLALVTSATTIIGSEELEISGILDLFDVIIGCDLVERHKPYPDEAIKACKELGIAPEDAIMIGDSKHDVACGNKAGLSTGLVMWSSCRTSNLQGDEKPDYEIKAFSELLAFV